MDKISTEKLPDLVRRVCKKHGWTGKLLAQNLNVSAETVSRWLNGGTIHKVHLDELLRLEGEDPTPRAEDKGIPFTAMIPRSSLYISMDEAGNVIVKGEVILK